MGSQPYEKDATYCPADADLFPNLRVLAINARVEFKERDFIEVVGRPKRCAGIPTLDCVVLVARQ